MTFVGILREMNRIYGVCPCCGEPFRLSDVIIYTSAPPPRTRFDELDDDREKLGRAIEKFEDDEAEIRAKATLAGRKQALKRLRSFAPHFAKRKLDAKEVKVIFDPVTYVAFPGLSDRNPRAVELIDEPPTSIFREKIHRSLEQSITAGNLEWRTFRIDDGGHLTQEP